MNKILSRTGVVKDEYASLARDKFITMIQKDEKLMSENYFKYFTTKKMEN